jgi:DnaJ-class molecular chaperone
MLWDESLAQLKAEHQRAAEEKARRQREWAERERAWQQSPRNSLDAAFELLGLPTTADADTIKARHRALLKRLHPDLHNGDPSANALLRKVTEAMDVLRAAGRV